MPTDSKNSIIMENQQAPQQQVFIQQAPAPKSNGIGTAGFVLALIGLILCWIPILDWILWLLGVIFSFIGVFRAPRGLAIAGLVISFIGIIILITFIGALLRCSKHGWNIAHHDFNRFPVGMFSHALQAQ